MHPRSTSPGTRAPYRRALLVAALAAGAAALIACQPLVAPAQAAAGSPAAPQVTVAPVEQRPVAPVFAQVGRVEAAQRVEIRARVAGHLDAVLFREGQIVRAGQPLFRIDTRPYDAAWGKARAELMLARAQEAQARNEAERAQRLLGEQAIARQEAERRAAAHAEAQARVASAEAALQSATLDREFALVTAPATGRIGRALVTAGNYVAAGAQGAPLATLTTVAPLHVYFDVGDAELISQIATRRDTGRWHARIVDAHSGAPIANAPVDFVDHEVVARAGTLRLRARVDRAEGLMPGQFVRVQLAGEPRDSLLVPEKAVGTEQGRRFVLVVTPQGQVDYRPVETGALHGEHRIVTQGLKAGERVIVSGLMRVRPGMAVQAVPAADTPGGAAAARTETSAQRKS